MSLQCIVVTPEQTVLDTACDFVALPLYDGEIGVASGHSPMIGRLGYGEMRIKAGGAEQRFYVDGGFVQVADDLVSVLTPRAVPAATIDVPRVREQLREALARPIHTAELLEIRDRLVAQSRGQLHVARAS